LPYFLNRPEFPGTVMMPAKIRPTASRPEPDSRRRRGCHL